LMNFIFGELGLKVIAPFFGLLGIFYIYKIGKDFFDEGTGILSAIFLGVVPLHIYLSSMAYQDILISSLLTVFIYYFHKCISFNESPIKPGLIGGLTALSKFTGLIIFPIILLYYFLVSIKEKSPNFRILKKCLIIMLISAMVCFPYYIRELYLFGTFLIFQVLPPRVESFGLTQKFDKSLFNEEFCQRFSVYKNSTALDYAHEVYLDFWGVPIGISVPGISNSIILVYLILTIFVSSILIYGTAKCILKSRVDRKSLIIYTWIAAWVISILVLQKQLIWGCRRLLPAIPPIMLLAACGLKTYMRKYKTIFYMFILLILVVFPSTQVAKALYAVSYFEKYSDALQYLRDLPEDSIILIHDVEQCLYYAEKRAYLIGELKPEYLNLTTLKSYNISYVVRFDRYLFYNLSKHVKQIDKMAKNGDLILVWENKYTKIYKVKN